MAEGIIHYRNKMTHAVYKGILKPAFFRRDPETVHDRMIAVGKWLSHHHAGQNLVGHMFDYNNPKLYQNILGIDFKNPIGLSAGFDKNAELTDILPWVGFGFAEVGSITGEACDGNPKPRLWRLPKSESIVVNYGLKNDGCEIISRKLRGKRFDIPIGVSVAMTNCKENTDIDLAVKDFAKAFKFMEPIGSYITVNISCPNTYNGQPFLEVESFNKLFNVLDQISNVKPIFIKLSPDLDIEKLDTILDAARAHRIQGIICTNLTKKRNNPNIKDASVPEKGGLSGKVVQELSDDMITHIYKREGKRFVIIGSGGVFSAEDAYKKIRLGASLIQLITGMIYEGPQVISEINHGLVKLLERDGFINISEAIGRDS